MQIMNLDKLTKDLWWSLTAFKTIDDLPDAIVFIDSIGEIVQYNKKAQELFGLNYEEFNTVRFDEIIKNGMEHVIESVDFSKPILATASVPGREFYVELNAVKRLGGYSASIRDMTKLTGEIVNDEKTIKFNNEKNAMLAKLEDDIKSPLTSINGFSKGLLDGLGGVLTEKQAKYVKIINSNSEELYRFLDKFLEFSKAESSIYESDFHKFDLVEDIKAVTKDYDAILKEKRIEFDIDAVDVEKRNVYTDSVSVLGAYRNIIETSIGMTEGGFIKVKMSHLDEQTCIKNDINVENATSYIQILITDSGCGIAEDEMKYLCEPYAQLEKGKKNLLRALQLGAASIMIKRSEGIFDIYSEASKGTRYTVIIPIEKAGK